jgi:hypothetical protein
MVKVERLVTEWGFPVLRWRDRISNMKGLPQTPLPRIDSEEVTRTLWINFDGVQVLAMDEGKPAVVGRWHEWDGLAIGSTERDLTPEQLRFLRMGRLQWVEHQTLTANFTDGAVNRIAMSAVPRHEMEELHRAIDRTFLVSRANFTAPENGVCWVQHFSGNHVGLERREKSPTLVNVSEAECGSIMVTNEAPVPSIHWREPVRTGLGGVRHHMVARNLFVGRGLRPGMHHLSFNSYKPGREGVVSVHADLAFLKGFRVVDSRDTNAEALQPLPGTLPGLAIVADFRYGLTLPLTSVWARDEKLALDVQMLQELFEMVFLPLVGQSLSDEQLGFRPKR